MRWTLDAALKMASWQGLSSKITSENCVICSIVVNGVDFLLIIVYAYLKHQRNIFCGAYWARTFSS